MTKDDLISEIIDLFQAELEELSVAKLTAMLSAAEEGSLLNEEFINEETELFSDDEEDLEIKEVDLEWSDEE